MINMKLTGRRILLDDTVWLSSSGSGIHFEYRGAKKLKLILLGDKGIEREESAVNRPRYAIRWNDTLLEKCTLDRERKELSLPLSPDGSSGRLSVLKLSEASRSNLGVMIETDGETFPLPDRSIRLEFIGDSITCGYGVEGNLGQVFSTSTEDVTKAFAFLTAEQLEADACFTCFSGFGIYSGYTGTGDRNADILVPDWYEKVGFCDSAIPGHKKVNEYDWDFSLFSPQVTVINLGTNDISFAGNDPARQQLFLDSYIRFLRTVRARNPQAHILCMLGIMGTVLNGTVKKAVEQYKKETGDPRISFVPFDDQLPEDGWGTDYHPTPATHLKAANRLTPLIRELL